LSACWSPDGKRIAVVAFDKQDGGKPPKARLVILEVDGDGRTEFPLDDVKMTDMPDWR
jgi:Tol biopolymer transport system component